MKSKYARAGEALAALTYGCSSSDVALASGLINKLEDYKDPNYGAFQKIACHYAAQAFVEAGHQGSFEYELFKRASQLREWHPELDRFSDAFVNALGRVYAEAQHDQDSQAKEEVVKAASGIVWPAVAGGVIRNTPQLMKQIATLGVGAGAGAGSLWWLMNRHTRQDEDELEAMKAKIKYYDKLTKEIRNELGGAPTTANGLESAVQNVL